MQIKINLHVHRCQCWARVGVRGKRINEVRRRPATVARRLKLYDLFKTNIIRADTRHRQRWLLNKTFNLWEEPLYLIDAVITHITRRGPILDRFQAFISSELLAIRKQRSNRRDKTINEYEISSC